MPETVILIRHAQSTFNAHYAATGEDPGHIDARLTDLGMEQVAEAREQLEALPFDAVYSSPFTRALQTATGLFGHRELPLHVTCMHRERLESSCDVGRSPRDLATEYPHVSFDHLTDPWWHSTQGDIGRWSIEPEEMFLSRVEAFGLFIATRPERRIAVVGHGTFFRALTGRSFANAEAFEWDGWRLGK